MGRKNSETAPQDDVAKLRREFLDNALSEAAKSGAATLDSLYTVDDVVPFGVFAIDYLLLGTGGVPRGRCVELFGPESGGKSTLSYRMIGEAQKLDDRLAMVLDTEGSLGDRFAMQWALRQGADPRRTLVQHPRTLEESLSMVRDCAESGAYSIIVLDSLAQVGPEGMTTRKSSEEKGWGNFRLPGEESSAVTEFLKDSVHRIFDNRVVFLLVNQVRVNLSKTYQATETTPGGHCLHHAMSLRLRLSRAADIHATGKESTVVGMNVNADVKKCKFSAGGRNTYRDTGGPIQLRFYNKSPLDDLPDVLFVARNMGVIRTAGAWHYWDDQDLKAQGEDNFCQLLNETGAAEELRGLVMERVRCSPLEFSNEEATDVEDF